MSQVAVALTVFVNKHNKRTNGVNRCLVQWKHQVLTVLQAHLHSPVFADGQFFNATNKPHALGTEFIPHYPAYDSYIKGFVHQHFVITTADKLSKNYVFVCKKHYIQQVLRDLNHSTFYTPLHSTHGVPVLGTIVNDLLQVVQQTAPDMFTHIHDIDAMETTVVSSAICCCLGQIPQTTCGFTVFSL